MGNSEYRNSLWKTSKLYLTSNHLILIILSLIIYSFVIGLVTRVMLDQALFAPCFITTFFVCQALMEGQMKSQILEKLEDVILIFLKNIHSD